MSLRDGKILEGAILLNCSYVNLKPMLEVLQPLDAPFQSCGIFVQLVSSQIKNLRENGKRGVTKEIG